MARRGRRRAWERELNGVLLLDKPQGLSSNQALQWVKRLYAAAKAGHTGSLDPLATGMLPICFGEATKFSQFMLEADKTYRTRLKLGVRTASGDSDGEVIAQVDADGITRQQIDTALSAFCGEIEQVPPMYSALKHQGQPLYKLARAGVEVERKARCVTVHNIDLLQFEADELELQLSCSKGTYVRTLADDLGQLLGCGAHVIALRRLGVGGLERFSMHPLAELEQLVVTTECEAAEHDSQADAGKVKAKCYQALDRLLQPVTLLVESLPRVEVNDLLANYIRQGQAVFVPNVSTSGRIALFNKEADGTERFLGVGEVTDDGRIAPRRLVAV